MAPLRPAPDRRVRLRTDDGSPAARQNSSVTTVTEEPRLGAFRERWNTLLDVVVPLALLAITTAGLFYYGHNHTLHHPSPFAFPVVALAALPLIVRRRYPRAVLACTLLAALLSALVPHMQQVTTPALAIALISFAIRRPLRETLAAGAISFGVLLAEAGLRGTHLGAGDVASRFFTVAAMSALGLYLRTRRQYVTQLRERARDLEREQELRAERAVDEERVRIARELHDAIAHHVSLLVVQAGAIRESLPDDSPTRAVAESMASTGRQALAEMRGMLGLLRTEDGAAERSPQPGVADITALVEQTRAGGVDAELVVEGAERPVPVGVGLSAYRIVQESLTNVIKHAGPAHARVLVRYEPDAVELRVTDDGRGGSANGGGGGHGIVGMRERVALYGGELFAGPGADGGWDVRARLRVESG
jgi:signal transduction histidine kinase